MSLSEEIYEYTDFDGLVAPRKCERLERNASGNGILYLSIKHILLAIRGERTIDTDREFERVIRSCQPHPLITGVYTRGPTHKDKNTSFDDYTAALVASKYLDNNIAFEVLDHGRQSFGFYNTFLERIKAPIRQLLWRSPVFYSLARSCTGIDPGNLKFTARLTVWWNCFKLWSHLASYDRGQDSELFTWLVIRGFDWHDTPTGQLFRKLVVKRFGHESEIVKRILQDKQHPFVKYFVF